MASEAAATEEKVSDLHEDDDLSTDDEPTMMSSYSTTGSNQEIYSAFAGASAPPNLQRINEAESLSLHPIEPGDTDIPIVNEMTEAMALSMLVFLLADMRLMSATGTFVCHYSHRALLSMRL